MTTSPKTISTRQAWLMAARPKTLPAAVGPVLVGAALAYADGAFQLLPALACLLGALLLQIGSNFANDYFDFFKGADTHDRLGPPRVTASGLLTPTQVRWGMVVIFGAAVLVGVYLIVQGGWPILVIGVAAILVALAYTGGPFPFGYYGLGDFFVFIFFGLVAVGGTYYVQALRFSPWIVLAAVPAGVLITNILVVNNLRDLETDRRASKRTLAVLLGRRATQNEYLLLLVVAYAIPLIFGLTGHWPWWTLLSWLTIPLAVGLVKKVLSATDGPTLNATLAGTARLSLLFNLLLAIGLVL